VRGNLFNKQTHLLAGDFGNWGNHDAWRRVEMREGPGKVQSMATLQLGRRCLGDKSTGDLDSSTNFRRALVIRRVPGETVASEFGCP